jgi:outer membrane biogenesis lipoprotein LolB
MKTTFKLSLAVVVAGLLTACAMTGLRESNAASQSNSVNAQPNNEWADRATDQFLDQLASAAVR